MSSSSTAFCDSCRRPARDGFDHDVRCPKWPRGEEAAAARAFHLGRRMFAVVHGTLLLARPGDARSHRGWLYNLFGLGVDYVIENCTHGYVLGQKLVAYRGGDFAPDVDRDDVRLALDAFGDRVTCVGLGALRDAGEQPWPSAVTYPTVRDFLFERPYDAE